MYQYVCHQSFERRLSEQFPQAEFSFIFLRLLWQQSSFLNNSMFCIVFENSKSVFIPSRSSRESTSESHIFINLVILRLYRFPSSSIHSLNVFLIHENCEICNFAGDNTLYSGGIELSSILENLKHDTKTILKWSRINSLKANPGKFPFLILGKNNIIK